MFSHHFLIVLKWERILASISPLQRQLQIAHSHLPLVAAAHWWLWVQSSGISSLQPPASQLWGLGWSGHYQKISTVLVGLNLFEMHGQWYPCTWTIWTNFSGDAFHSNFSSKALVSFSPFCEGKKVFIKCWAALMWDAVSHFPDTSVCLSSSIKMSPSTNVGWDGGVGKSLRSMAWFCGVLG